ncbi:ATP-dependent DNA helicase RecQ-like [Haliotis rubra]|uniref:ATP-dependent DNA helicase RecQ-like n=1 Tax=Haliotis rubra TaxID=36100 RepID=UPI001EE59A21|nr:ATP-dependent DNA helicase RecQ-like [Haliotis rubra]
MVINCYCIADCIVKRRYGKSLIYEILPILHNKSRDKTAFVIVIVPLNVILDQQLRKFGNKAISLSANLKYLNSTSPEGTKLLNGHYTYLFAHPESIIDQKPVNDIFLHKHFQEDVKSYIVIDEAHCILDWGDSFRPSFQRLHKLRAVLPHATILAMTATLSLKGQNDIAKLLALKNHKVVSTYPARDNISIIVIKRPAATSAGEESAQFSVEYCIEPLILELIDKGQNFPLTIVYFSGSQNWVGVSYELSKNILGPKFYVDSNNEDSARVVMYHASLEKGSDQVRHIKPLHFILQNSNSSCLK